MAVTQLLFGGYKASVPNVPALRAYPIAKLNRGDQIGVGGGDALGDMNGGTFAWDPDSIADDDGLYVVKPYDLAVGRWVIVGRGATGPAGAKGEPGQGLPDLQQPTGSKLVGFKNENSDPLGGNASTGFIARSVDAKLKDFISLLDYGVSEQNADNSAQLQAAVDDARRLAVSYAVPPRIVIPAGIYRYSTSPNWALTGLHLDCQPGATFVHTGTGIAFIVDGGQGENDGGFACMKVTGGLVIRGNTNTTDGAFIRAIHSSVFELEVQNVSEAGFRLIWTVCNEYTLRCSVLHRPAFNPVPKQGIVCDSRRTNQQVSACTFYNPIIEGLPNAYGIVLNDAIMNNFLGGTSESNAGGVFISDKCSYNRFVKTDFEFNVGGYDIYCLGQYNQFEGVLSDHEVHIDGNNNFIGGKDSLFNKLILNGNRNVVQDVTTNAGGGGVFQDNGADNSVFRIRNATNQNFPADYTTHPSKFRYLSEKGGNGYLEASADQVTGGSTTDTYHYKYGTGKNTFGGPGGDRFTHNSTGTSFNGATPIARRTLPNAPTDAATTQAAVVAILQFLKDWGAAQ